MSAAFVFPGQGSQAVGMGKALAQTYSAARAVFEEVDAALGDKLSTIMWEGPAEKVTLTENAQPALVAVSLAAMRVLETEAGVDLARDAQFVSGHRSAVERAVEIAKARSVRRAMLLPVSAPFHSALMQPAADVMAAALARVTIQPPRVPLVANVTAQSVTDPVQIVQGLIAQVS